MIHLTGGPGRFTMRMFWRFQHLEGLLERLGKHGQVNSHIVLSTQFEGRLVEAPTAGARPVTVSPGWSR